MAANQTVTTVRLNDTLKDLDKLAYVKHMLDEARYLGVDYGIVWDLAKNKAPALRIHLKRIVAQESPSGSPDS